MHESDFELYRIQRRFVVGILAGLAPEELRPYVTGSKRPQTNGELQS